MKDLMKQSVYNVHHYKVRSE